MVVQASLLQDHGRRTSERVDSSMEDHFVLDGFDGDSILDIQTPSIDPRIISSHGGPSQPQRAGGTSRQSSWATIPTLHQGRGVNPNLQRATQQARSIPMKSTPRSGKDASTFGQQMRGAAQRVRSLSAQLLDVEK